MPEIYLMTKEVTDGNGTIKEEKYDCSDCAPAFGTLKVPTGASFPETPAEGDMFYRTDKHIFYVYRESAWSSGKVEQLINICGSYPGLLGGNTSGWLTIGKDIGITSIEDRGKRQLPACIIKALNGRCSDASSVLTLTVRKNGVDTSLTGTVSATGTFRITGSVVFAKNDEMSIAYSVAPGGGNAIAGLVAEIETELI